MSSFVLKLIAIITMSFDHTGNVMIGHFSWMNLIGRIAFPLFIFQLLEGYKHTKNFKKYLIRMILFAVIAQIPFMMFLSTYQDDIGGLNIFFTLSLGLLSIYCFDKIPNKMIGFIGSAAFIFLGELLKVDYGSFGVALIFIMYLLRTFHNKTIFTIGYIVVYILHYIPLYITYQNIAYLYLMLCCMVPIIFMNLYNGKKGPSMKYLFYLFYPIHLVILVFIKTLLLQ